jgi:hypothetical protein
VVKAAEEGSELLGGSAQEGPWVLYRVQGTLHIEQGRPLRRLLTARRVQHTPGRAPSRTSAGSATVSAASSDPA